MEAFLLKPPLRARYASYQMPNSLSAGLRGNTGCWSSVCFYYKLKCVHSTEYRKLFYKDWWWIVRLDCYTCLHYLIRHYFKWRLLEFNSFVPFSGCLCLDDVYYLRGFLFVKGKLFWKKEIVLQLLMIFINN